jgi:phosphoglycolate phosphatase-like HAD superfamily hydrolase
LSNQGSTTASVRVYLREGFSWDGFGAYIIDIDGTLMKSPDGIHFASFAESIESVLGQKVSMDGISLSGNTDRAILRAAFENAGIPASAWEPKMDAVLAAMCSIVEQKRDLLRPTVIPGVVEFLNHLEAKGAALGLGTGNLEGIGWLKLEVAGLRKWFRFGGFSDHHEARPDLIGNAAVEARRIAGQDATLCVVGDTPRDIAAAAANKLPVIAVSTGRFSFEELMECKPDACTENLQALLGVQN